MSGYRNDGEFSLGRHLRDILSSPIMISNDRILANVATAALLERRAGVAARLNGTRRNARAASKKQEALAMNVAFKQPKRPPRTLDAIAEALLLPSGIDGVYARTAVFEDVVAGLARLISRLPRAGNRSAAVSAGDEPPAIGEIGLSEKLSAFSRLRVLPRTASETEIRDAVERYEAGEDWTTALSAADLVLSPAACYPVYPLAASRGEVPAEGLLFDVACGLLPPRAVEDA